MTKLSDAALVLLGKAAQRDDRLAELPKHLPAAARNAVVRSLLKQGLLIEDAVPLNHPMAWRTDDTAADGDNGDALLRGSIALRITDAGFRAINLDPPEAEPVFEPAATVAPTVPSAAAVAQEAAAIADALDAATVAGIRVVETRQGPVVIYPSEEGAGSPSPPRRTALLVAATLVLKTWDDQGNRDTDIIAALEAPMEALRTLLAEKAPRDTGTPRKPREGTKQEAVLTLLRRTEGATIAQIMETTAWASHTVRGFLAGLKKKGIKIDTLEKVRMVGPNKEGAKGSYSVYAITG